MTKNEPFKGKVKIGDHSGLRKLMRAARRGKIPEERMAMISASASTAACGSRKSNASSNASSEGRDNP